MSLINKNNLDALICGKLRLSIIPLINIPFAYIMGGVAGTISSLFVHKNFGRIDILRSIVVGGIVADYAAQPITSLAAKMLD